MAKPRKKINAGDRFGHLTVMYLCEHKDKTGHLLYHVKCDCGKEYDVPTSRFYKENPKCLECDRKIKKTKKPKYSLKGEIIGNWKVLSDLNYTVRGAYVYLCECLKCGEQSIKNHSEIINSHSNGCKKCTPDYNFSVSGNIAEGTLPCGTTFLIDADMIPFVSQWHWRINTKGYIQRSSNNEPKLMLHWIALGYANAPGNGICIDHINRNRFDYRRENLRFVTHQQNSMNRSIQRNNTSGYVGVFFMSKANKYGAVIGINNHRIHLGTSKNPIICAQMYNVASKILFGEFSGHRNDVPEASIETINLVTSKCEKYLSETIVAQRQCYQNALKEVS